MYFKKGDIVLFKVDDEEWKEGKVISNNFAMCNLPDCNEAYYYIEDISQNNMPICKIFEVDIKNVKEANKQ